MKAHVCSACGCEGINVFSHFKDGRFLGYLVSCPQCGLKTKDFDKKADAIRTWNNPNFIKEEK